MTDTVGVTTSNGTNQRPNTEGPTITENEIDVLDNI